jgi:UDP-N-acetyl-D-glucosamine dehydrogenase
LSQAKFVPAVELADWIARVDQRTARVGIVGLGYVGLPLALLLSEDGFRVTGFDIDQVKVRTLNAGASYIHRIEPTHIAAAQSAGFQATSDFAEVAGLDAVLICVPTPLHPDHTPDMRAVEATMASLAPHLQAGQLVVLESTTYPGTTDEIVVGTIERHGHRVQRESRTGDPLAGVMVAFSPEREDPGNLTTPRRSIPKIVGGVGGVYAAATVAACALYGAVFERTIAMSTPAAAEMTKLLENIYRSVNIAMVNELKQLCLHMGIDIWEVIDAAATKPFGFQAFQPGPGVGGHCIPVDPFYLAWKARQFGFETRFIELAGAMNESMPAYVVKSTERALERCGTALRGAKVLVLGVAYKRDVDDLRESPALTVIDLLRAAGAEVAYNDPYFPRVGTGRRYDLQMESTPLDHLHRFDCVVIVTDHSCYDFGRIVAESRLVVDSRNATRTIDARFQARIVRC